MNAGVLESHLKRMFKWALDHMADDLGLPKAGTRDALIERILEMHADPVRSLQVAHVLHKVKCMEGTDRKRQRECRVKRVLAPEFDRVASHNLPKMQAVTHPIVSDPTSSPKCHMLGVAKPLENGPAARNGPVETGPVVSPDSPELIYYEDRMNVV